MVALVFPWLPVTGRQDFKRRWSRQLLDALGVHLHVCGKRPRDGLIVCNHVSWLDIYAINALVATTFVCKDDVRHWPLIGWLGASTGTLFMKRGSRSAAMRTKERLADHLRRNNSVCIFPEGTTTSGELVLPFHSALLQSAIDAHARVAPAALSYCASDGAPTQAAAYAGDTTLWQSLRSIVGNGGLRVHIEFLPAIEPAGQDRRQLARQAHRLIADKIALPVAEATGASTDSVSDIIDISPGPGHRQFNDPCNDGVWLAQQVRHWMQDA